MVLMRGTTHGDQGHWGAELLQSRTEGELQLFCWGILMQGCVEMECVERPQDMRAMIFQLSTRHIASWVCFVSPYGYKIIEKVILSLLSYVICLSTD